MKSAHLSDMVGGWFVGDFSPTLWATPGFEVGVKRYAAGTVDAHHYHKIATEITVIISGTAMMCDKEWSAGDIVILEPNEPVQFTAITDVVLTVVKVPSAKNDKYLSAEHPQ